MKIFRFTKHARERLEERPIVTAAEVDAAISRYEVEAARSNNWQVKIVVKRTFWQVLFGSEGDTVVACLDPKNRTVKTIMLEGSNQVYHRRKSGRTGDYFGD
jgi:hypothetical protein